MAFLGFRFSIEMGCGSSKSLPPSDKIGSVEIKPKSSYFSPIIDVGRPAGGNELITDKRAAQLAAAERRAALEARRGLAAGPARGVELAESGQRQELIGKINGHYQAQNKDAPMGLNLATVEQLKRHLESVRKGTSVK